MQPSKVNTPEFDSFPPDDRAVARVSAANDRRSSASLERQGAELRKLKRSHDELSQRVAALQEQSERTIAGLLDGMAGLERRAGAAAAQAQQLAAQARSASGLAASQREELRSMAIKAGLDKVTAAVNTAQAAAYGQTGSLTAPNNLMLIANQIFWSLADPVLRGLGVQTGPSPGVVDFLAPLGSLATGQALLASRQHERFVSGVSTFDGTSLLVSESLQGKVANGFFPKLRQRTDLPVSLTPLDATSAIFSARVIDGVLSITAVVPVATIPDTSPPETTILFALVGPPPLLAPKARVAWIVDLGADVG